MEWMISNWILLVIAALCVGMYFFGRGCCAHGKHEKDDCDENMPHSGESDNACETDKKGHGCCH